MRLIVDPRAMEDLRYWRAQDRRKLEKINRLIAECLQDPSTGTGKPEALKHALAGCWSRRIDREHRLVYKVEQGDLIILSCRYHYG